MGLLLQPSRRTSKVFPRWRSLKGLGVRQGEKRTRSYDAAVRDISTSFKKQRTSFNDGLKERALREEAANMNAICEEGRDSAAIPTAKAKGKPKSKAVETPRAQARKKK